MHVRDFHGHDRTRVILLSYPYENASFDYALRAQASHQQQCDGVTECKMHFLPQKAVPMYEVRSRNEEDKKRDVM